MIKQFEKTISQYPKNIHQIILNTTSQKHRHIHNFHKPKSEKYVPTPNQIYFPTQNPPNSFQKSNHTQQRNFGYVNSVSSGAALKDSEPDHAETEATPDGKQATDGTGGDESGKKEADVE